MARQSATPVAPAVIRRYDLGSSPVVTDLRTAQRTGRLGDVLAGDLDSLGIETPR